MNEQSENVITNGRAGPTEPPAEFALAFTAEAVKLMRRSDYGWRDTAEARFDDEDLRTALDGLRERIAQDAPHGHWLRLIIPDDQILYTGLTLAPASTRAQAVRNALDGLTPYPVGELAFDWDDGHDIEAGPGAAAEGAEVQVAAVARQTLREAEDFACRHGFAPDSFVAAPRPAEFPREPRFGRTDLAARVPKRFPVAVALVAQPTPLPPQAPQQAEGPWISHIPAHIVPRDPTDAPLADPAKAELTKPAAISVASAADEGPQVSVNSASLMIEPDPAEMIVERPADPTPSPAQDPTPERSDPAEMPPPRKGGAAGLGALIGGLAARARGTTDAAEPASQDASRPRRAVAPPPVRTRQAPNRPEKPRVVNHPKPLSARARAILDRAAEARENQTPIKPPPRAANRSARAEAARRAARARIAAPGRGGWRGILPFLGVLLLGLLLVWAFFASDDGGGADQIGSQAGDPLAQSEPTETAATDAAPQSAAIAPPDFDPDRISETAPPPELRIVPDAGVPSPVPTTAPAAVMSDPRRASGQPAPPVQAVTAPPQSVEQAADTNRDANPAPTTAPQAAADGAGGGASTAPAAAPVPVAPAPNATTTAQPAAAPQGTALRRSVRPGARPAGLRRAVRTPAASTAAAQPSASAPAAPAPSTGSGLRSSSRPGVRAANASTPAADESAAPAANPGARPSNTLRRSSRPQTAPQRSRPAARPDPQPAVPRNPQPFERAQEPEPSSARPPARPTGQRPPAAPAQESRARGVAPLSLRDYAAWQQGMRDPLGARIAADLTHYQGVGQWRAGRQWAQARPQRRPAQGNKSDGGGTQTRSDAVNAALAVAISARPPAKGAAVNAATPGASAAATQDRAVRRTGLKRSARPRGRPAGLARRAAPGAGATSGASTAGLVAADVAGRATDSAVNSAIASAVAAGNLRPGQALAGLSRSSPPRRRPAGRAAASARDDAAAAQAARAAQEAAEADATNRAAARAAAEAQARAEAEAKAAASAVAERRRMDDELQRQAEARARNRAAADAAAEARARAQAEARARAQAEAERKAAERKNQVYRPPEIDNEPEVKAAIPKGGSGTLSKQATQSGFDAKRTQLIGVIGAGKASRGLVRLRNGRVVTLRIGDKINGGKVTGVSNNALVYVKNGKRFSLPILSGK